MGGTPGEAAQIARPCDVSHLVIGDREPNRALSLRRWPFPSTCGDAEMPLFTFDRAAAASLRFDKARRRQSRVRTRAAFRRLGEGLDGVRISRKIQASERDARP